MEDYKLGTSLRDVLTVLGAVVRDNRNRENPSLFKLTAEELYRRLDSALYGENSEYESLTQEECWARFKTFTLIICRLNIIVSISIYLQIQCKRAVIETIID